MRRQECQGKRTASTLTVHDLQSCFVDPSTVYPYICMIEHSGVAVFSKAISCTAEHTIPGSGGYVVGIDPVHGRYLDEHSVLTLTAAAKRSIREDLRHSTMLVALIGVYDDGSKYVEQPRVNHYILAVAVRADPSVDAPWAVGLFDPNGVNTRVDDTGVVFRMMQEAVPELPLSLDKILFSGLAVVNKHYEFRGDGVCFMGACADLRLMIELWAKAFPEKADTGMTFLIRGRTMLDRMRYTRKIHPVSRLLNLVNPHMHPDDRRRELKYVFKVEPPTEKLDPRDPRTFSSPNFTRISPAEWKRRVREEIEKQEARAQTPKRRRLLPPPPP
jgi:hypothetical protein